MKLGKMAKLIRSKNAGPFHLTFDIMFEEPEVFEKVKKADKISLEWIAKTYKTPIDDVELYFYHAANSIKFTIPRPYIQGDLQDTDCFGGQQYSELISLDIAE